MDAEGNGWDALSAPSASERRSERGPASEICGSANRDRQPGGAFPAFMRTRYSGSAVSTTGGRTTGLRPAGGDEQGSAASGRETPRSLNAGLRIGPAATGCTYPRSRKSRSSGPTVAPSGPTARPVSRLAICESLGIAP